MPEGRAGTPGATSGGVSVETAALLGVFASGVMARAWEQPRPLQPPPCKASPRRASAPPPREERGGLGSVPGLGL